MARSIQLVLKRIRMGDLQATIELLEIKDPKNIDQLVEALTDNNEYVRSYAAIALSCYHIPEVTTLLVDMLKNSNPIARAKAIDTLIMMKEKSALPSILELENDSELLVQISVKRAKKLLS